MIYMGCMAKPKYQEGFDESFYWLAGEITRALERNKDGSIQKDQVEELLNAERMFKETIFRYRQSTLIYKKFLVKVKVKNKNILSARPYFRETAVSFSKRITPAIKSDDVDTLKTFDINYQFIKFIKDSWLGPFPEKAAHLYERVHRAREVLIQNNMPLAVNRAKLFYRKTPKSHLTLIDFIGICAMGLAAGVDKWCGPYSPVFRSVCIGRMVGNLIDAYSETLIHFYPSDKRILYKAHTLRSRLKIDDISELTEAVKDAFVADSLEGKNVPKTKLNVSELSSLMSAASTVSADATVNDEGFGVYQFTPDDEQDIEEAYVHRESTDKMLSVAKDLPPLHKKILRLKGIKI